MLLVKDYHFNLIITFKLVIKLLKMYITPSFDAFVRCSIHTAKFILICRRVDF